MYQLGKHLTEAFHFRRCDATYLCFLVSRIYLLKIHHPGGGSTSRTPPCLRHDSRNGASQGISHPPGARLDAAVWVRVLFVM
jgi:hypothetical protein